MIAVISNSTKSDALTVYRKTPRTRVTLPAKLNSEEGHLLCDCRTVDLSKNGARLEVSAPTTLPNRFTLTLSSDESRSCRVRWRSENCVGVHFDKTVSAPQNKRFWSLAWWSLARRELQPIPDLGRSVLERQGKP
jgi:hypothetical protein